MNSSELILPPDFLIGSGVSDYGVEDAGKPVTDWDLFRYPNTRPPFPTNWYEQGVAERDLSKLAGIGLNAQRMGLSWARIIPEEGRIDRLAVRRYRKIVDFLQTINLTPVITLNHLTLPIRVSEQGGWENDKTVKDFTFYTQVIVDHFGDIDYWLTLNEPSVTVLYSHLLGTRPPGKRSLTSFVAAARNLVQAHEKSYEILKKTNPEASIGFAHYVPWFEPSNPYSVPDQILSRSTNRIINFLPIQLLKDHSDFIGINFYTSLFLRHDPFSWTFREREDAKGILATTPFLRTILPTGYRSDTGWPVTPDLFLKALLQLNQRFHKTMMITENGLADANDHLRFYFILSHLAQISEAIRQGVDITGYFYWSSVDGREGLGEDVYKRKFGLITKDFQTGREKITEGAKLLGKIAKGGYEIKLDDQPGSISLPQLSKESAPKENKTFYPDPLGDIARRILDSTVMKWWGGEKRNTIGAWKKIAPNPLLKGVELSADPNATSVKEGVFKTPLSLIKAQLTGWPNACVLKLGSDIQDTKKEWLLAFRREGEQWAALCNLVVRGSEVGVLVSDRATTFYAIDPKTGRELPLFLGGEISSRNKVAANYSIF